MGAWVCVIEQLLDNQFSGTLLSDGYKAYASYAVKTEGVVHAQYWIHTRRQFFEASESESDAVDQILVRIGLLYKIEEKIRELALGGEQKRWYQLEHSKPVVNSIFKWLIEQKQAMALLLSELLQKHPKLQQ